MNSISEREVDELADLTDSLIMDEELWDDLDTSMKREKPELPRLQGSAVEKVVAGRVGSLKLMNSILISLWRIRLEIEAFGVE